MSNISISPSLLSADFGNLSKDVSAAVEAGADSLHCDVMDGHYVPNITFGPMVIKAVRKLTKLPLPTHLMIEHPEKYIAQFADAGSSEICVHPEACIHLHSVLQQIKALGVRAGVALNPSTPLCMIEHVIGDIDALIIMTVNPGFGGQSFIESMLPKIECARKMAQNAGVDLDIAVDGGIDNNTVARVVSAGANVIIAGSSVFAAKVSVKEACDGLRERAKQASMSFV